MQAPHPVQSSTLSIDFLQNSTATDGDLREATIVHPMAGVWPVYQPECFVTTRLRCVIHKHSQ
jgi:hypothetical protein